MGAPTSNDKFAFKHFSEQQKLQVIKLYLWQGYNMQEVANRVFPHDSDAIAQNVSVITRCYGFEGQNKGIFRRWGIDQAVTDKDLIAFVRKYRKGCQYDGHGEEMRRFLQQRIQARNASAFAGSRKSQRQPSRTFIPDGGSSSSDSDQKYENAAVVMTIIVAIILIIIFRKKIWAVITAIFAKILSWILGILPAVIALLIVVWLVKKIITHR